MLVQSISVFSLAVFLCALLPEINWMMKRKELEGAHSAAAAAAAAVYATPASQRCSSNARVSVFSNRRTMGVNSLPKTVARQRRDCDLNPGPSVTESSTLTTRLPSKRYKRIKEE